MIVREADRRPSCPQCKSQDLICVGRSLEVILLRCDSCKDVFEAPSAAIAYDPFSMPTEKPTRSTREDAPQSALRSRQYAIDATEWKKPAPKRKVH
jgi:ribosomal protein L37AE/L43A